jgi:predicted transcriptional regulator
MKEKAMRRANTGDREFELLRWVAGRGPTTVGEATDDYGVKHELSRSTVQTMLERLYRKGHLRRRKVKGVYHYSSPLASGELLRRRVGRFVERALGGSVAPFVAYLAEQEALSDRELADLEALIERLQSRRSEP